MGILGPIKDYKNPSVIPPMTDEQKKMIGLSDAKVAALLKALKEKIGDPAVIRKQITVELNKKGKVANEVLKQFRAGPSVGDKLKNYFMPTNTGRTNAR